MPKSADRVIVATLDRWIAGEISLNDFVDLMQRHGWSRAMVYQYLDDEATQDIRWRDFNRARIR